MRCTLTAILAASLLCGSAVAAPGDQYDHNQRGDGNGQGHNDQPGDQNDPNHHGDRGDQGRNDQPGDQGHQRWSRGERIPDQYRRNDYFVDDWRQHGLRRPPRGYHWVRNDDNDFFLAAISSGTILRTDYRDARETRWDRRYQRRYTYNDDTYYQECRNSPDPAGVLAGGLIGALIGNAVGSHNNRTGTTIAGVIVGAAAGAALTKNLDCEDRSYAYKTYYDGFNAGRPDEAYRWSNPRDGHRGEFRVTSYFNDRDGFRCANFTQRVTIGGGAQVARGVGCRQADGSWAVVR